MVASPRFYGHIVLEPEVKAETATRIAILGELENEKVQVLAASPLSPDAVNALADKYEQNGLVACAAKLRKLLGPRERPHLASRPPARARVLEYISTHSKTTPDELCLAFGLTRPAMDKITKSLRSAGRIVTRARRWYEIAKEDEDE